MKDDDHQDIDPKHLQTMAELGQLLDLALNPNGERNLCFCLLITEFGDNPDAKMNYLSNGAREDMVEALREFLARVESDGLEEVDIH